MDFVVLNMGDKNKDMLLIFGRSFLNTTNAYIYVGSRQIQLHFEGTKERFAFAICESISTNHKQVKTIRPRRRKKQGRYNHPKR